MVEFMIYKVHDYSGISDHIIIPPLTHIRIVHFWVRSYCIIVVGNGSVRKCAALIFAKSNLNDSCCALLNADSSSDSIGACFLNDNGCLLTMV